MTEAEEESTTLLLHDVRLQLRRQAARKVRVALEIGVRSLAEQTSDEIREQLSLTAVEYLAGVESLKEAMRGISGRDRRRPRSKFRPTLSRKSGAMDIREHYHDLLREGVTGFDALENIALTANLSDDRMREVMPERIPEDPNMPRMVEGWIAYRHRPKR